MTAVVLPFPVARPLLRRAPPTVIIDRQRLRRAADWQLAIVDECRRHRSLNPSLVAYLKGSGLLSRCTFLAAAPGEPLVFRFIGQPTVSVLGTEWARRQLGQPEDSDPHRDFATSVGGQYHEAIESGEALYNRIVTRGVTASPFAYDHTLIGWTLPSGERALLSAITVR